MRLAGRIRDAASSIAGKENVDEFLRGFEKDYKVGRDDTQTVMYDARERKQEGKEAPRWDSYVATNPTIYRARELMGMADPAYTQARLEAGMDLEPGAAGYGQLAGTVARDITQDASRGLYWLLNAAQASAEIIGDKTMQYANRQAHKGGDRTKLLFGTSPVIDPETGRAVPVKAADRALELGILRGVGKTANDPRPGYSVTKSEDGTPIYQKRNFEPGHLATLAIPGGIAINSGLGLLTPFGGAEGYKAANPSQEDPTKTNNVLAEIADKYIAGKTGNLLPYSEFVKVRPDVSPEEYRAYQMFKYDNDVDLNPLDGDIVLPTAIAKYTNEGVHGPEVQFMGRCLPVTTGVLPFVTSLAGSASGVTTNTPIRSAATRGLAGLVAGQVLGNVIEGERRRRNEAENIRDGSIY